jgi:hypothetical protein
MVGSGGDAFDDCIGCSLQLVVGAVGASSPSRVTARA